MNLSNYKQDISVGRGRGAIKIPSPRYSEKQREGVMGKGENMQHTLAINILQRKAQSSETQI